LANINKNVLLADVPHIQKIVRKRWQLMLSGFLNNVNEIKEKAEDLGLKYEAVTQHQWAAPLILPIRN